LFLWLSLGIPSWLLVENVRSWRNLIEFNKKCANVFLPVRHFYFLSLWIGIPSWILVEKVRAW
jgi:hypothetical protein